MILEGFTVCFHSISQERVKEVPTLSSSEYGHRLQMFTDHPDRQHVRIAHVKTEFYRRNGIEGTCGN